MQYPQIKKYTIQLEKKTILTENTLLLRFDVKEGITFVPGQFVIMYIPHPNGILVKRSYSIASDNSDTTHIEFCVTLKKDGLASKKFIEMQILDTVEIEGPYGRFGPEEELTQEKEDSKKDKEQDDFIFIAAGSGVAPFRSILFDLQRKGKQATLIYGFRTEKDYLFENDFKQLQGEKIKIIPTASQPKEDWKGDIGRVNVTLKKYLKPKSQKIFICGSTQMVMDTLAALDEIGFLREQIKFEGWG